MSPLVAEASFLIGPVKLSVKIKEIIAATNKATRAEMYKDDCCASANCKSICLLKSGFGTRTSVPTVLS